MDIWLYVGGGVTISSPVISQRLAENVVHPESQSITVSLFEGYL